MHTRTHALTLPPLHPADEPEVAMKLRSRSSMIETRLRDLKSMVSGGSAGPPAIKAPPPRSKEVRGECSTVSPLTITHKS